MTKPQITEGEWVLMGQGHNSWYDILAPDAPIKDGDIVCQDVHEKNAKAISAVPDMMEVLIEIVSHPKTADTPTIKKAKSALEKAGVTL